MYCIGISRYLIHSHCNQMKPINNFQLHLFQHKNQFQCFSMFVRKFNFGTFGYFHYLKSVAGSNSLIFACRKILENIPFTLKNHSVNIIKTCVSQCEFVVAHRLRRSQQMFNLYTKLWDEWALKQLVKKFKVQLARRGKNILLGASIVSVFNWDNERITEEEISRYSNEMQIIEFLRYRQDRCLKEKVAEGTVKEACDCPVCAASDSEWVAFVDKDNLVVWKKEEDSHKGEGLYSYKVYGKYDDVTAIDFLEAQIDLDYRRVWDTTAVTLHLVDSEPNTQSDVIYWESKWPKLFTNRDYVFKRRFYIDYEKKLITIVNKSTIHPDCPTKSAKQRVTEYWSYMVIKPNTELNEPGIEFSLTYFDNPGVNMPTSISVWITVTAMPDYLSKLRQAALGVAQRRKDLPQKEPESIAEKPCDADPPPISVSEPTTTEADFLEKFRAGIFLF